MRKRLRRPTPLIVALLLMAVLLAVRDWRADSKSSAGSLSEVTVRIERVVDGDTVVADDGRRIRLLGIDTPEMRGPDNDEEPGARAATEWLRTRIQDRDVLLRFGPERTDRYGRVLAWIFLPSGELINRESLAAGHAKLVTRYGLPTDLEASLYRAEMTAKVRRRGRWARRKK